MYVIYNSKKSIKTKYPNQFALMFQDSNVKRHETTNRQIDEFVNFIFIDT